MNPVTVPSIELRSSISRFFVLSSIISVIKRFRLIISGSRMKPYFITKSISPDKRPLNLKKSSDPVGWVTPIAISAIPSIDVTLSNISILGSGNPLSSPIIATLIVKFSFSYSFNSGKIMSASATLNVSM